MFAHIISVVIISLLSQGVGFLRTLVIAFFFGATKSLDAYYLALVVPALFTGVIGGALQAGFVPVYMRRLTARQLDNAAALRGAVFWTLLTALISVSIGGYFSASYWVPWVAQRGGSDLQLLTIQASQIVIFSICLNGIGDYFSLVLNCHGRFVVASAAPIGNTLVSIPVLLVIGPTLDGLAWSALLGSISQLAIVSFGLAAKEMSLPINWRAARKDVVLVGRFIGPILPAFVLSQLQSAYIQTLPAALGEGAVSIFGYANRLHSAVEQVFVIGVGTVLLPHLAELVAREDREAIRRITTQVLRSSLVGAVLLEVCIWLFGDDVVRLLLARGSFDREISAQVSMVWLYLAIGTFPFAVSTAQSKLVMALGRPAILAGAAALIVVVVYAFGEMLPRSFGVVGVALVVVIGQCVRLVSYSVSLREFFDVRGSCYELSFVVAKLFLVAAIATVTAKWVLWSFNWPPTFISMVASMTAFSFVAAGGLWLTKLLPGDVRASQSF